MTVNRPLWGLLGTALAAGGLLLPAPAADPAEPFAATVAKMQAAKPDIAAKPLAYLHTRYALGNKPLAGASMSRGKPLQGGVRVRLADGVGSWEDLGKMSPED